MAQDKLDFAEVLHQELDVIAEERGETPPTHEAEAQTRAWQANLQGLAFSGGGIRSATFCLGVLQKLVEQRQMQRFDYLSTVSGGGYIGAWFSALLQRRPWLNADSKPVATSSLMPHFIKTQAPLKKFAEPKQTPAVAQLEDAWNKARASGREPGSIAWLRRYSNYLSPQMGLSGDFVAAIAFWMRNTLLNQVLLSLFFFIVLLTPQWLFLHLMDNPLHSTHLLATGLVSVVVSMFMCALELPRTRPDTRRVMPWVVLVLALAAAYSLSLGLYHHLRVLPSFLSGFDEAIPKGMLFWMICIGALYTLPWWVATLINESLRKYYNNNPCEYRQSLWFSGAAEVGVPLLSGLLGGALIFKLASYIQSLPDWMRDWWAAGFGTALMLGIFCITLIVHQGLMARLFRISQFEWWARLGGLVLLAAVLWAAGHALLVYAPASFEVLGIKYAAAGGVGWLIPTLTGLWFARGGDTGKDGVRWKEWMVIIAPYLLVLGLLGALSAGTHQVMFRGVHAEAQPSDCGPAIGSCRKDFVQFAAETLKEKNQANVDDLLAVLLTAGGVFLLLAWRLDVNLFSIHYFYRNRLVRCYLGASRYVGKQRDAHPFTGFDPCDDISLQSMQQRPLHLLNASINLSHPNELAWQDRMASSFTFSPVACGYSYQYDGIARGGYCPSADYMGGAYLGTALATSGAAASPNMGFHTSPVTAFMMTVFNVRLGHWCPNPVYRNTSAIQQRSPTLGAWYLFKELFAMSDERDHFVYLSDGGHFENTGVYELVRRRCRSIMLVDAAEDAERVFEDFANLTRKCYTDFGVRIDIDLEPLRLRDKDSRKSTRCWAVGDIIYPDVDGKPARGVLLYVKPSLVDELPEDVRNYAAKNDSFPHQPTPDQFFDEAQFESYRKLGYVLTGQVLAYHDQMNTPSRQKWEGFAG